LQHIPASKTLSGRSDRGKHAMLAAAVLCCGGVICLVLLYKVAQFVLNCLTVKQRYKESPLPGPDSPGGLLGEYYAVAPEQLLLLQQHNEHTGQVHSFATTSAPLAGHFCCMQAMSLCC
jgi:hypothetical protein